MFGSVMIIIGTLFTGCKKDVHRPTPADKFPSDVAVEWMRLHMHLNKTTPGFNSVVAGRSFGYAGLTLYEAIVPASRDGHSIASQLSAGNILKDLLPRADKNHIYSPAAANAAMASITKALFGNTSPANVKTIDSLEASFKARFYSKAGKKELEISEDFGKKLATAIFDWSKTDGGHEAYLHVTNPSYIPPTGPGLWIPTPPAFAPIPIHSGWGTNRSFFPGIAASAQAPPPIPYSENSNSAYYKGAKELYDISLSLSHEDSIIARFWGDLPVNFNVPAHATGILTQLIELKGLKLEEAAIAYAKHGMAMNDALITVLKAKYTHNTIRPISFIRSVLNHPNWNTVIPTPPHPEYPAAHGLVSGASATVLEDIFGKHFSFTDHTYDNLYGARTFKDFKEYASEAGHSRVLAGIHYKTSVMVGLEHGKKVGEAINSLGFSKGSFNK